MAKGKLKVCRVEYETNDRTNWKAVIVAYNMEDAVAYLRKKVKEFNRYTSTSMIGDIDAFEDKAFKDYFVQETKVVETIVAPAETPQPEPQTGETETKCPWCDKPFKNKKTLGTHIKKFHMDE